MVTLLLHLLRFLPMLCGGHRQVALENLALRHQLAVYNKMVKAGEASEAVARRARSPRSAWGDASIPGDRTHPGAVR